MDFTSNVVGAKKLDFVNLGILAINASDKLNTFGTPATRVRRPTDGTHWSTPYHVFGEATVAGMNRTRLELDYS